MTTLHKAATDALNRLKNIRRGLTHQRRFGTDSMNGWRSAATLAEGDVEELVIDLHDALAQEPAQQEGQEPAVCDFTYASLLDDLREAAATLRRYEVLHRAKNTEESSAKAEVNAALATRFEETIAKAAMAAPAEYRALLADKARIDWLSDPAQSTGNVQLPTACVTANIHSLRGAIDMAMALSNN